MDIELGWTLDGSAWADAGVGAAGSIRLGPRGLLALLQTRLGLTRPAVEPSVRIAQMSRAVSEVSPSWCAESARTDPWATARTLLRWRDVILESGAHLAARPGLPERIDALARLEDHLRAGSVKGRSPLTPGPADDLLEVTTLLQEIISARESWPLGITRLTCHEPPSALPGLWTRLMELLEAAGVQVDVLPAPDPADPELVILEAQDEWTAAEAAARFLAGRPEEAAELQLLATSDTVVLDAELVRRGLPAVGVADPSADRTALQILPLYLSIARSPVDVQQLAAFLDLRILDAPQDEDEPIGLVPSRARRRLLDALAQEPGTGGTAWERALEELRTEAREAPEEDRRSAETALAVATALDVLLSHPIPPEQLTPARLRETTGWLGERLRALSAAGGSPQRAAAHLAAALAVLDTLDPQEVLSPRMLSQILESAAGRAASPLARPEATGRWSVSMRPAPLRPRGGDVLWWGADQSPRPGISPWDEAEVAAIAELGGRVLDPAALAALETEAGLRGLRGARRVLAVRTLSRAEERTTPSSLLAHLVSPQVGRTAGDVAAELSARTIPATEAGRGENWELAGSRRELTLPAAEAPDPFPKDLTRRVAPAPHLLPRRFSFSQAENLLGCRQKWTYQSGLEIRPASIATVPTGNRMIGTLVHAVVERLVQEAATGGRIGPVGDGIIADAFDSLVPQLASELLLPGHEVDLTTVRSTTVRSLREFFDRLHAAGLSITAVESSFEETLPLPLRRGEVEVPFIGFRDVLAEDAEGGQIVIDLKWTAAASKYPDLFDTGEALQLAAYAHSLPGGEVDTGYFLLAQGEFVAANPALDPHGRPTLDVRSTWAALHRGVTSALDDIRDGTVDAASGQILLDAGQDLSTPRQDAKKTYAAARREAREAGGIVVDARCDYCDFSLLCGLRGDRS